ncbi:ARMT1-like domain-containing protein [bacterium]|nr:ARMT1-like domain-containing protein [bacterium]
MKATNACLPCMIGQAYNTASRCTADEALQRAILDETLRRYVGVSMDESPAVLSQIAFETCRELSGVHDPYLEDKRASNVAAMRLYPELHRRVAEAADPLHDALVLAVAGNIIDLAIAQEYDLQDSIVARLQHGFDYAEVEPFRAAAARAGRILYIADNAGEIVFDRLLIEVLGPDRITLMVRGGPIVNDVLAEDVEQVGLAGLVRVVDTGCNYFGLPWEYASETAREEFQAADMVISKGHANFETVTELGPEADKAWYLLKVKCGEVARQIGVTDGDIVLVSNETMRRR